MDNLPENKGQVELRLSEQGYVTLPFNKDDFKDFVVGLLGKPQVIEGEINKPFEVDINNVRNIYELVNQRVTQQNDGILIQFNARIIFSDNTSVLLNSIQELISYNVIKPVVTEALHLTFQYLLKFQDKKVPEKQEINISFIATEVKAKQIIRKSLQHHILLNRISSKLLVDSEMGYMQYSIKHTARTWGTDIESILVNHFKTLFRIESPVKTFLRNNKSVLNGMLFLCILTLGIFLTRNINSDVINNRNIKIEKAFKTSSLSLTEISNQIKFLANEGAGDISPVYLIGILISFIISFFAFIIADGMISQPKHSYLLLSSESLKNRTIKEKSYKQQFSNYILSLVISIVIGLLTNFIYEYLTKK